MSQEDAGRVELPYFNRGSEGSQTKADLGGVACHRSITCRLRGHPWGARLLFEGVVGDSEVLGPDLSRWLITVSYERPQAVIQCA